MGGGSRGSGGKGLMKREGEGMNQTKLLGSKLKANQQKKKSLFKLYSLTHMYLHLLVSQGT